MAITHVSNAAFAIKAMCEKTKQAFGVSVDQKDGSNVFMWAFKISSRQAKYVRLGKIHVQGSVTYDANFNGCPYCGSQQFYICNRCKTVVCYHGEEFVTCPNCGYSSSLRISENVDLTGGDF